MKTNKSWLAVRPASGTARSLYRQVIITVTTTLLLLLSGGASLLADTHYVSIGNKRPKLPYTSWSSAATNIQQAVDAATAGDEVVVGDGVYATGWRQLYSDLVRVLVDKAITIRSANGPQVTVIDGGLQVMCVAAVEGASLTGFTVRNGYSYNGLWTGPAGGIYCFSTDVCVTDCVITGSCANQGGGIYSGTLFNCTLSGNTAVVLGGGGVPPEFGDGGGACGSVLYNCTLTGNKALHGGGAAYCTLYNCVLTGNTANGASIRMPFGTSYLRGVGGGASSSSLYNCTLTRNSSTGICGGVHDSELYNCILYFNTVLKQSGGANYDGSSILNYCCTTPLPRTGSGNFALSKNGVNTLFADYAGGNLRLGANSPCINAGNNAYAATTTDLDGNPRIVGGVVDTGAYEFQGLSQ